MKYYTQFYTDENIEALGSDGVFILDGRNAIRTMILDSIARAYQLANVKRFHGFEIMKGERFDNSVSVSNYVEIKYPDEFYVKRGYDARGITIPKGYKL